MATSFPSLGTEPLVPHVIGGNEAICYGLCGRWIYLMLQAAVPEVQCINYRVIEIDQDTMAAYEKACIVSKCNNGCKHIGVSIYIWLQAWLRARMYIYIYTHWYLYLYLIYIYMYIIVYTYTYIYIYVCIQITYMHACMHTCMHTLHYITVHYIAFHYITWYYITFHYVTYIIIHSYS